MPRYSLRGLLIVITAIACGIGLLRGYYLELTHVETSENVERVDWLPPSASNISYYRSHLYTAYEFDMSEAEFKRWASFDVAPITEPVTVNRYSLVNRYQKDFHANWTDEQFEEWEARRCATVKDGLHYSHRRGNGGGVSVAYDRTKGRVFYQANPR